MPEGAACISSLASVTLSSANLLPAIAAEALMSALTIVPSTILADVTVSSAGVLILIASPMVRIKKSAPLAGALANIISLPSIANPSLGLVPLLGF